MPDAYEEAKEVRDAITRYHPEWLRNPPDKNIYTQFRLDWARHRGGFWDRVLSSPAVEALRIGALDGNSTAVTRLEAEKARALMRGQERIFSFDNVNLTSVKGVPMTPGGAKMEPVSPWRLSALAVLRNQLVPGSAYADWLYPWIEPGATYYSSRSWKHFWLYETQAVEVPRWWLRWAFEFLQSLRAVGPGTPCDAQLATYLLTCDYFVSADKALVQIAEKVRSQAPFPIGVSVNVPGDSRTVPTLLEALRSGQLSVRNAL